MTVTTTTTRLRKRTQKLVRIAHFSTPFKLSFTADSESELEEAEEKSTSELLGGLFTKTGLDKEAPLDDPNAEDGYAFLAAPTTSSSLNTLDWSRAEMKEMLSACFVTGKWGDEADDDEDGDDIGGDDEAEDVEMKEEDDDVDDDDEDEDEKTAKESGADEQKDKGSKAKKGKKGKERLKAQFGAEFDETNEYYNTLKEELNEQAQVCERKDAFACL